jgi:hypothetical protein|tara:strand:- start:141 stop:632 length:492 start_codon:yes stop_codon:yes gene_type:complete
MSQALATDQELDRGVALAQGVYLTPSGAVIDDSVTLASFTEGLARCQTLANATLWCIGDLLHYGEDRADWGESYTQAIEVTGKSVQTLMQAVRVAKAYRPESRVTGVSWSHHREALTLTDPDERTAVLHRAASEGLSAMALRAQLAPARTPQPTVCPQCGHSW